MHGLLHNIRKDNGRALVGLSFRVSDEVVGRLEVTKTNGVLDQTAHFNGIGTLSRTLLTQAMF